MISNAVTNKFKGQVSQFIPWSNSILCWCILDTVLFTLLLFPGCRACWSQHPASSMSSWCPTNCSVSAHRPSYLPNFVVMQNNTTHAVHMKPTIYNLFGVHNSSSKYIGDDTGHVISISMFAHKQQLIEVQQPNNKSSIWRKQIKVQLNSKQNTILENWKT
jgi:hypothetical protein